MTMVNFFLKGGPLMYVLLALSIIGLGLVIAKYRQIFKVNSMHRKLAGMIGDKGDFEAAFSALTEHYFRRNANIEEGQAKKPPPPASGHSPNKPSNPRPLAFDHSCPSTSQFRR